MTSWPSLLLLADGRFPTGGHAHSGGAEPAIESGDVHDLVSLDRFLRGRLATTGAVEAAFAAAACHDVRHPDGSVGVLRALDAELDARMLSPRAREVSRRLGRQFLRVARSTWPSPLLDGLAGTAPRQPVARQPVAHRPSVHQPVAIGATVAVVGGDPADAARLAVHHLGAAVTGAAVRLLAFDPASVVAVQVGVGPLVDELVDDAVARLGAVGDHLVDPARLPADGGALAEILAEDHGTWPARLFVG